MMIKIEMVKIPASQDQEIRSFKIGKYPITQEQYQEVMGTNPSRFQGNPQNPVENVSYDQAKVFCQKLSKMTGKNYRLPTEAEWEYACRAGTETLFSFGDDLYKLERLWLVGLNSQKTTHPVGRKLPNAWGIYDMSGNVWEMTQEAKLRGGSKNRDPTYCYSRFYIVNTLAENIGFRVVCDK